MKIKDTVQNEKSQKVNSIIFTLVTQACYVVLSHTAAWFLAQRLADSVFGAIVKKCKSKKDGRTEGQTDVKIEIAIKVI